MPTEPEPDALAPDVLAKELENILLAHTGGKIIRPKAEVIVQKQLAKLAEFYAAVATPELTASAQEQVQVAHELHGSVAALIRLGAEATENLTPDRRAIWQQNAARAREAAQRVLEMFS